MNPELRTSKPTVHGGSAKPPRTYDLEERLLEFASAIIDVTESLPSTKAAGHLGGQLLRSGTSPYGNHGEAQEPESQDDFIHKLKICLKELRECRRWARLIDRKQWLGENVRLGFVLGEVEELIRIFKASIKTAEQTRLRLSRKPDSIPKRRPEPGAGSTF